MTGGVSRATYSAVVEYTTVCKAKNLELKTDGGEGGSSTISSLPDTLSAVATTTNTPLALITEMKRVYEVQAAAHITHIVQLTALMKVA